MTESIAGEHSWVYIWDKETKHDRSSGSLAMRFFRRGYLLYHPAQWYEAGFLRNRALDLVELRARNIGHNSRGQPGLTTSDPSKVVGFSSFAAALLLLAQLKTNFGLTNRRRKSDAPSAFAGAVTDARAYRDCTDVGHDLALGQMPVAHQPSVAIIGQLV